MKKRLAGFILTDHLLQREFERFCSPKSLEFCLNRISKVRYGRWILIITSSVLIEWYSENRIYLHGDVIGKSLIIIFDYKTIITLYFKDNYKHLFKEFSIQERELISTPKIS